MCTTETKQDEKQLRLSAGNLLLATPTEDHISAMSSSCSIKPLGNGETRPPYQPTRFAKVKSRVISSKQTSVQDELSSAATDKMADLVNSQTIITNTANTEPEDVSITTNNNQEGVFVKKTASKIDDTVERLEEAGLGLAKESTEDTNNNVAEMKKIASVNTKAKSHKRVQRRVSFADAVGFELASIKIMSEGRDTPPHLEHLFMNLSIVQEAKPILCPRFEQPISKFSQFMRQLKDNCVSLESVDISSASITGMVKVKNLAYNKLVQVLYTTDRWKTQREVTCYYVNPRFSVGTTSAHDAFSFQLEIDECWDELEFCISFECAGGMFWDNNSGANYKLIKKYI